MKAGDGGRSAKIIDGTGKTKQLSATLIGTFISAADVGHSLLGMLGAELWCLAAS